MFSLPSIACYGEYCSTQVGEIYDYPWKIINQVTKPYPTSFISVLDGSFDMKNVNKRTNRNSYNFSYQSCTNSTNCVSVNAQNSLP